MYVKSMGLKEVIDIFQCRAVIEGLSCRLAATQITAEQVEQLRACFKPFVKQDPIDVEAYAEADRNFHTKIMKWSGNAVILRLEVLSNIHLRAYQAGLLRPPKETISEHFAIIEALEKRNGKKAEQLMRAHIERSLEALQNMRPTKRSQILQMLILQIAKINLILL